jgi:hypothetical protein
MVITVLVAALKRIHRQFIKNSSPLPSPSGANFLELRTGEVRLVPGPTGEDFSGSCTVTSRNPLIQKGATTATKSGRFDPEGASQGLSSRD